MRAGDPTAVQSAENMADTTEQIAKVGGLSTALFAGFTAQQIAAIGGLTITIFAFMASLWFQHRRLTMMRAQYEKEDDARDERMAMARERRQEEIDARERDD